jgi:hypothetical protein
MVERGGVFQFNVPVMVRCDLHQFPEIGAEQK